MSTEPESDQSLPVNLHFPDQRALAVDIDAIMRKGLRMRRNRKALVGVVAAVAAGVLGVSAAYLAPRSSSSARVVSAASPTGSQQSSAPWGNPPVAAHATVLYSKVNPETGSTLSAVAWLAGGGVCFGTTDLTKTHASESAITCGRRPSTLSATKPSVLAPQVIAGVTNDTGSQLVVGFVSGDVTKVSLKIRGHLYDAAVTALFGSPSTGAYMAWASPANGAVVSAQDFTQVTGYNSHGVLVARAHP
jgi:hypothetical protein